MFRFSTPVSSNLPTCHNLCHLSTHLVMLLISSFADPAIKLSEQFLLLLHSSTSTDTDLTMSDNNSAPSTTESGDALTNTLRPLTDCFLTVRIIKSFEYRTTKNLLLPHLDATTMTVGQLKETCRERTCTCTLSQSAHRR